MIQGKQIYLILIDTPQTSPKKGKTSSREETLQLAKTWLTSCETSHIDCSYGIMENIPLPHRVLDLGSSGSPQRLSLFESDGVTSRYVALSYCWGQEIFLITTKENLSLHKEVIQIDTLPRTFQDAIAVARAMGIRFLWIDSLCIIQDSREDWEIESAKMGSYFSNAECVIAAQNASKPMDRCLIEGDSVGVRPCWIPSEFPSHSPKYQIWLEVSPGLPQGNLINDWRGSKPDIPPLERRAWTFQERLLARRTLTFGRFQLSFSCLIGSASESFQELISPELCRKKYGYASIYNYDSYRFQKSFPSLQRCLFPTKMFTGSRSITHQDKYSLVRVLTASQSHRKNHTTNGIDLSRFIACVDSPEERIFSTY